MTKMKIALLEQTSLPRIILYLKKKKIACRTDLKTNIGASQQAIYNALPKLFQNNLIIERKPKGSLRRKDITLTKKGLLIAEILEKLEASL